MSRLTDFLGLPSKKWRMEIQDTLDRAERIIDDSIELEYRRVRDNTESKEPRRAE